MKRHLLTAALLLLPATTAAQQAAEAPRTVTVNATATVERAPDEAVLNVAVVTEGSTAAEAASANADRMAAVVATLRELGLENRDIRTTSYNLSPRYARGQPRDTVPPAIVGYTATNNVTVTVDSIPRVGGVIDAVVRDGANRVDGVFFRISDPEPLHLEAVQRAVAKARTEAGVLAEAAGERLGRVLTIHTSGYAPPPPRPMYDMAMVRMEAAQAAPTPIEGGELSVSASVSIVYELVGGGAP